MLYSIETLNKWGINPTQYEKTVKQIKIKGYRLTFQEKEELLYHICELKETEEELKETINWKRKYEKEIQNDKKLVTEFVKEWKRLLEKYEAYEHDNKTITELVDLWYNDYFELYFKDDHLEGIKDIGGKKYAQYYLWNSGVVPVSEVSLWKMDGVKNMKDRRQGNRNRRYNTLKNRVYATNNKWAIENFNRLNS